MKTLIKKFLIAIMCVVTVFSLFACGTYQPGSTSSSSDSSSSSSSSGGTTDEDDEYFTAKLVSSEKVIFAGQSIEVIWTDEESSNGAAFRARVNTSGEAKIKGLDGKYKVTLSALPEGYTYDPNIYTATNDDRDTEIVLYKIKSTTGGNGSDWRNGQARVIPTSGVYRTTLTETNYSDGVWFMFEPTYGGVYSVESMADITANTVNPILEVYNGTSAYLNENRYTTCDDGAGKDKENTYTKNFRWEKIWETTGVGQVLWFKVRATALSTVGFPYYVDFIIERDGDVTGDSGGVLPEVVPTHDFEAAADTAFDNAVGETFKFFAYYGDNNKLLNGKLIQKGDDGYYYIVDEAANVRKRLYAMISGRSEVIDAAIDPDNTTSVASGFSDDATNSLLKPMSYTYDWNTGKWVKGKQCTYRFFIRGKHTGSEPHYDGYAEHCNSDGVYPVTEELKNFLYAVSASQRFFNDGQGVAEVQCLYKSSSDNQWLFNCGYYA